MNGWNAFRRYLGAGIVAVGLVVVPQAALAGPGHCCLEDGTCITVPNVETCGMYECVICAARPCGQAACFAFLPGEGPGDEGVSSASEGETEAESVAEPDDSAVAMDHDAKVCIGDPLKDAGSVTPSDAGGGHNPSLATCPPGPAPRCRLVQGYPFCCWDCFGEIICLE